MKNEYELLNILSDKQILQNSVENIYTYHTLAHIDNFSVKNMNCNIWDIPTSDAVNILSNLPLKIIKEVQKQFVTPTAAALSPDILNVPCPTGNKCQPFTLQLSLININDIIKLMFQESPAEILREIYYLSKVGHVNSYYVEDLTPMERTIMIKFIIDDNKNQKDQTDRNTSGQHMTSIGSEHGFDQLMETPNNEFGF